MTSGLAAQADEITRQNATTNPSANPTFLIFLPPWMTLFVLAAIDEKHTEEAFEKKEKN
jgi:hypothetical protein